MTFGPNLSAQRSSNPTFITPAPPPQVIDGAQATLQVSLSNQLALQLGKLFQDLFPINQNFEAESATITDQSFLTSNSQIIITDILELKATILLINQITIVAASRIPAGYPVGNRNADPTVIAGLNTAINPNAVINTVDNLYLDVTEGAFESAQADYATLRNQLRPYFGI